MEGESLRELVVARDADLSEAGHEYAADTGREFVPVDEWRDLCRLNNVAVAVASGADVDGELFGSLFEYGLSSERMPGLIAGRDVQATRRRARVSSRALTAGSAARDGRRVEIRHDVSGGIFRTATRFVAGREALAEPVRRLLAAENDVVAIVSHSDGIDVRLSDSAILCGLPERWEAMIDEPLPACVASRTCYRKQLPLAQLPECEDVISVRDVSARILFLDVCFGMLPRMGNVDHAWALLWEALENEKIASIVASWDLRIGDSAQTTSLIDDIARGTELGVALVQYGRSGYLQYGNRYCLFGDPRLRGRARTAASARGPAREENGSDAAALALLRTIHVARRARGDVATAEDAAGRLLAEAELDAYRLGKVRDELVPALQRAVLDELCDLSGGWSTFPGWWLGHARLTRAQREQRACPFCRGTVLRTDFATIARGAERSFMRCEACGFYEDVPAMLPSTPTLQAAGRCSAVALTGGADGEAWSASLIVGARERQPRFTTMTWPCPDGRLAAYVELPETRTLRGPVNLGLIYMSRLHIGLTTTP
jgi:hypothetical protein